MSAGKNNTSDFVPNFHGMLTDLTTIGVQRVTGSSPLRDKFFFSIFMIIKSHWDFYFNFLPNLYYTNLKKSKYPHNNEEICLLSNYG